MKNVTYVQVPHIHNRPFQSHIKCVQQNLIWGGFSISKENPKQAHGNIKISSQAEEKADQSLRTMKEEISLELSELGNLAPKHEPMTPNQRDKSEREKHY